MNKPTEEMTGPSLTSYARHGGCSCKLGAEGLAELLDIPEVRSATLRDNTPDDAAILPIGDGRALLTSVDFQNAIVDDAELAGEIAARNALSDLFACGVRPMYADVVLVLPYGDRSLEIGKGLMRGIARACIEDGCSIVGGHTIQGETPIVGLSVTSIARCEAIKRKSGAQAGDLVVLTKKLGTGIAVAARQLAAFSDRDYADAVSVLRQSNRVGVHLGEFDTVTAMTDVTGFGLLGHASEVANSSDATVSLSFQALPFLPGSLNAAREGKVPALAESNLAAYACRSDLGSLRPHEKLMLCDPQTNGGLLICVRPDAKDSVLALLTSQGSHGWIVGRVMPRRTDGILVEVVL